MSDSTRYAWAYLSRVAEPPCVELATLVHRVGPVEAAERVRRGLSTMSWRPTPTPDVKPTGQQQISSCSRAVVGG